MSPRDRPRATYSLQGEGGCNLAMLQRTPNGYQRIRELAVSNLPVGAFESKSES